MKQEHLDLIYKLSTHPVSPAYFDNPNKYLFWFFENIKPVLSEADKLIFSHIRFFDFDTIDNKYFREGELIGFPILYGTSDPNELTKIKLEVITFVIAIILVQKTNSDGTRISINAFQDKMIVESISKGNGEKFSLDYDDQTKIISFNIPDLYDERISKTFYESLKNKLEIPGKNDKDDLIIMSAVDVDTCIGILFNSGIAQSFIPEIQDFLNSEKIQRIIENILSEFKKLNSKFGFAQDENVLKNYVLTALLHSWIKSCKYNYMITSVRYNQFKQPSSFAVFLLVSNEKVKREILDIMHISLNIAFNALNEIQKWIGKKDSFILLKSDHILSDINREKKYSSVLIYRSSVMQKLDMEIDRISKTNEPVLLVGETGTGKDLIAYEIHQRSNNEKPFKIISQVEDEINLKRLNEFGTIYFPEITDISESNQKNLMHFLKGLSFQSSNDDYQHLTRFLFASNADLLKSMKTGKLREDFYYQINVVSLIIPPLRERVEDIPLLTQHFVKFHSMRIKGLEYKINRSALDFLSKKDFKGNVRELEHLIINAIVKSESEILEPSSFFEIILQKDEFYSDLYDLNFEGNFKVVNKRFRKIYFEKLLRKTKGNISEAAKISGLTPPTVYHLVKTLKIKI